MDAIRFEIHKGPSRFDLMIALFVRRLKYVFFELSGESEIKTTIEVSVCDVGTDGADENWIVKGWHKGAMARPYEARYNTRTRKGVFIEDPHAR